ncbi:cation efflux protein [Rhodotorula sp. JG-1b]|nr:cation efflux protein [Rhodotorula sp. JG-1b]
MSARWIGRTLVSPTLSPPPPSSRSHLSTTLYTYTSVTSSRTTLTSRLNNRAAGPRRPGPMTASKALHSHSHGGHGHSHAHGHTHGGVEETQQLASAVASLRNPRSLDPGSRITLVGLVSNVGLTVVKGLAGYILASSALLADAAHSGSDLIADVVTLVSYRIGRWQPSPRYPYGYGKFESLGSLVVSFLLFATAAGIGLHSYHHLLLSLSTIPSIPADLLASLDFLPHGHSHGPEVAVSGSTTTESGVTAAEGTVVDARAMYFALFSILVKEWLYRATLKVAREQHSNVLLANAYHHRSDSLGSLVALLAIGAARVGYPMLDPVGGLVVAGMIAKQGFDIGKESLGGLVDQVTDEKVQPAVYDAIRQLSRHRDEMEPSWRKAGSSSAVDGGHGDGDGDGNGNGNKEGEHHHHLASDDEFTPSHSSYASLPILAIPSVRLFASGPSLLIDVEIVLPASLTLAEANEVERQCVQRVRQVVGAERVREVVVRLKAEGHQLAPSQQEVAQADTKKEQ